MKTGAAGTGEVPWPLLPLAPRLPPITVFIDHGLYCWKYPAHAAVAAAGVDAVAVSSRVGAASDELAQHADEVTQLDLVLWERHG